MTQASWKDPLFITPAMAEILLSQKLVEEARIVIEHLKAQNPCNPRLRDLMIRLGEIACQSEPREIEPKGMDRIAVESDKGELWLECEITSNGLEIAKRKARYSGKSIVRIFQAAPGPRGVRKSSYDIEIDLGASRIKLLGMPRRAVCVTAVGFLSNTGEFVPLSISKPLEVSL